MTSTTNQYGGVLWSEGTNTTLVVDSSSKISASTATLSGGVAYLLGSQVSLFQVKDGAIINSGQAKQQSGGVAYLTGTTSNTVKMTNDSTVASCSSPTSGGCFYLAGTGSNEISV